MTGTGMLAFRPEDAPIRLVMPKGRWHIDTLLGTLMATDAFLENKTKDGTYQFRGEGTDTLTLVRRFKVSLEFATPKSDPFIDPVFYAKAGVGHMDDFRLMKVERKE